MTTIPFLLSERRPWFKKFRAALAATSSLDAIENLLRVKVQRWRGRSLRVPHLENDKEIPQRENGDEDEDERERKVEEELFFNLDTLADTG